MIEIIQRQKELRVRISKEVTFIASVDGRFNGIIQNISVGGSYMTTNMRLDMDESFEFQYCFMKTPHTVQVKILRQTFIRDNYFGYGCQFVGLPKNAERDIRQFVYRQQLNKMW